MPRFPMGEMFFFFCVFRIMMQKPDSRLTFKVETGTGGRFWKWNFNLAEEKPEN